jgi:ribosomal protein S18 acetylase RimI-like enzyme
MKPAHVPDCNRIVLRSEPWVTLGEKVDFKRSIALKQAYVCLGRDSGKNRVMGFIIFTRTPVFARGGYLRALGVSEFFRRAGVGRKLIEFAEKTISRKAGNIYLCVSSFNKQALAFYKKLGYKRIGKIPGLIKPDVAEFIFHKKLSVTV